MVCWSMESRLYARHFFICTQKIIKRTNTNETKHDTLGVVRVSISTDDRWNVLVTLLREVSYFSLWKKKQLALTVVLSYMTVCFSLHMLCFSQFFTCFFGCLCGIASRANVPNFNYCHLFIACKSWLCGR